MLKAELIGNLGQAPEMRYTPEGQGITSFSVATNSGRDKPAVWVRVSCWGKLAELANEYLDKGSKVFIRGRLSVHEFEDRQGDKRYSIEVTADELQFLSGGKGEESETPVESDPVVAS